LIPHEVLLLCLGVAAGAFAAGWFCRVPEIVKARQIAESLAEQLRKRTLLCDELALEKGELAKRLEFSMAANRDLTEARIASEKQRDEAAALRHNAVTLLHNHRCPTVRIPGAVAKPKKRVRK
jgi:hypothetical protein